MNETLPVIYDARELVEIIELTALRTFEISGRRLDRGESTEGDESANTVGPPREGKGDAGPQISITILEHHDERQIETRFRSTVLTLDAEFVVEVGLKYELTHAVEILPEAMREFLERVAVMAAYPFLREGVATTAARMELPVPVLGLLKAGTVNLPVRASVD